MTEIKGKIAVLVEDHFDATEFKKFNEYFPAKGYKVEYVSHLWNQEKLSFASNPEDNQIECMVDVTTEIDKVKPTDYQGILLIGAYAMDRLRYQENPVKGEPNQAPAVKFIREAMKQEVKIGTICHSLWLLCADKELLKNRRVTCAHNIICDVENAGADVQFDQNQTQELVVDGNLITGKHPGMVDLFMNVFVTEMEK